MNYQKYEKGELIKWAIKLIENKSRINVDESDFKSKVIDKIENVKYKEMLLNNYDIEMIVDEIEYEELSTELLLAIGYIQKKRPLYFKDFMLNHEDEYDLCSELSKEFISWMKDQMCKKGKTLELSDFLELVIDKYGIENLWLAIEMINNFIDKVNSSPYYQPSKFGNINSIDLSDLFSKEEDNHVIGNYFDQRYIDYLNKNNDEINNIHWRKFEEMTAEFFSNEGFDVTLKKGRKDGGIDLILQRDNKKIVAQCKRYKSNVGTPIVRELDDVIIRDNYDEGIIICARDISKDSKKLIDDYKMKIKIVNGELVSEMLSILSSTSN